MLGDFNSGPEEPEYELLVGAQDACYGRVHQSDAFADTWALVHQEERGEATWVCPPYYIDLPDRRLDYCFVSPALSGLVNNAWVDHQAEGSDHQPCWIEMDL